MSDQTERWRREVMKCNAKLDHKGHSDLWKKVVAEAPVDELPKNEIDGMLALYGYYDGWPKGQSADVILDEIFEQYSDRCDSLTNNFLCALISRFNTYMEDDFDFVNARRIAFEAYPLNVAIYGEAHGNSIMWLEHLAEVSRALDCPLNANWFEAEAGVQSEAEKSGSNVDQQAGGV